MNTNIRRNEVAPVGGTAARILLGLMAITELVAAGTLGVVLARSDAFRDACRALPGGVTTALSAPTAAWTAAEVAALDQRIVHEREAAARHERALRALAVDPRWAEPAQREHLARAMRESSAAFSEQQRRAAQLERQRALHH